MPGCQASFHSGWGTPRGEISDPSVPLKCPPGARAPPASLCRLPPAGAALTNSLLLLYKLSSRWQRPSLGVRMAPSFPSPAKWKPSSVANTSSLVTLRQPISSCGGERPGFPGVPQLGGLRQSSGWRPGLCAPHSCVFRGAEDQSRAQLFDSRCHVRPRFQPPKVEGLLAGRRLGGGTVHHKHSAKRPCRVRGQWDARPLKPYNCGRGWQDTPSSLRGAESWGASAAGTARIRPFSALALQGPSLIF